MKKIVIGIACLATGCTVSDTYHLTDVGENNVATATGVYLDYNRDEHKRFKDYCLYLLGIKLNHDCSPTEIAMKYNLKTITEQNTQWIVAFPFVAQRTTIAGIPK